MFQGMDRDGFPKIAIPTGLFLAAHSNQTGQSFRAVRYFRIHRFETSLEMNNSLLD